jgi:hypothetical protein
MFPNVRMMIVAMLASMVAIICGMGMFAAFGINHEPFARLPGDSPPLQLVFDHTVSAHNAAATPFGVRFQTNAPGVGARTVAVPAATPLPAPNQTMADTTSAPEIVTPSGVKPPASVAADTAPRPGQRRRLVRRAPPQRLAEQSSGETFAASRPAFQWTLQPAPLAPPAGRAAPQYIAGNRQAVEPALPTPVIQ